MSLTIVDIGNEPFIRFTIVAPQAAAGAASIAVTFTRGNPDGTSDTASSPDVKIDGPDPGTTTIDGVVRATTTWTWQPPIFTQPGWSTIHARSTAGILAGGNLTIATPQLVPIA